MRACLWMLCLFTTLIGCSGGSRGDFAPVSGRVVINGEGAAGIVVTTDPDAPLVGTERVPGSSAVSGVDGFFRLRKSVGSGEAGAYVGRHRVTLAGRERVGVDDLEDMSDDQRSSLPKFVLSDEQRNAGEIDVPSGGLSELTLVVDGAEVAD
ncbi:MAG: hypothetical protein AAF532_02705 [Planctomycetota bacterium]